ncbi:DUF222 domain-containing protein [Microbacterium sp.]|uniref:DUF222 domain-containing protein n=1 Tax=Microbacterium sp. TaxID=51671 RepID=UPI003C75224A
MVAEPLPDSPEPDFADRFAGFHRADEVVDALVACGRSRGEVEAREIRLLGRAYTMIDDRVTHLAKDTDKYGQQVRNRDIARRSVIAELATATRASEWTIARLIDQAHDLCDRFSPAVDALAAGEFSRGHLLVIHECGAFLTDPTALDAYLDIAMDRARSLTPGRLRPALRAIAERFAAIPLDERARTATDRRCTGIRDLSDGEAEFFLQGPATLIHGIQDRLTSQARAITTTRDGAEQEDAGAAPTGGNAPDNGDDGESRADTDPDSADAGSAEPADTRTMDQLRADIAVDLLLTGTPDTLVGGDGLGAIRATAQVTVPALTILGHSNEPCLLAGYGPIDTATAKALAGHAPAWERVLTHPLTGSVLAVDRYRPGPALTRHLRARDEHCRRFLSAGTGGAGVSKGRGAVGRSTAATSTTPGTTRSVVRPATTTSPTCAGDITPSSSTPPGRWSRFRRASSCGPARTDADTPTFPNTSSDSSPKTNPTLHPSEPAPAAGAAGRAVHAP